MEPRVHVMEKNARSIESVNNDLERAGVALEKAGRYRNRAFACAIGGVLLAAVFGYFADSNAYQIAAFIRIGSVALASVLFFQANGHEIAAGRLLKGGKPMIHVRGIDMFTWLLRQK